MKRLVWMIFLLLALPMPILAQQWSKVASHNHSNHSDGTRPFATVVQVAKKMGFDVLIISDHLEKIVKKGDQATYLDDCQKQYNGITVIAGVEVTTKPCHTVVFGKLTLSAMAELYGATTVVEVIAIAHRYSLLAVAAHPFDPSYPYDYANAEGIDGEEFFNGIAVEYTKTFGWFRQMMAENKDVFAWAGVDSHNSTDPNDAERWLRATWVWAKSNAVSDIMTAFRQGQTYASRFGYRIVDLNFVPGFATQEGEPRFKFKIVPPVLAEAGHRINLYRDGKVIKWWTMLPGVKSKIVEYLDASCPIGDYTYLIEVVNVLVTSPIRLSVAGETTTDESEKSVQTSSENWHAVTISSQSAGSDFIMGPGQAVAFISNRSGAPAVYATDLKEGGLHQIISLDGLKEQFAVSPGGDFLFLGQDGKIRLLLVDRTKNERESLQKSYRPMARLKINNTAEFFPTWVGSDSFVCQIQGGEIQLVKFKIEKDQIAQKAAGLLSGLGGEIGKWVSRQVKVPESVECELLPVKADQEFMAAQKDEKGFERICVLDRFGQPKKWLTESGFNASEPKVGQSGALSMIGSVGPIVFSADKGGARSIYRLNGLGDIGATKPKITKLTSNREGDGQPAWAYYTNKVYFARKVKGVRRLYEMKSDGKEVKELPLE